ncbi:Na+/H+ antiporter NhaA [Luteipulveratus mongoliensis]|uniref:Na(+)/H(+) antiporter NhaA n=1 Tax=Luteipulveratus mongoliensis TaxID=571913 RepID=A0A0K1JN60_9MICO|nr:Na+/H+ antiporter NhaA [Luteipulveratus mongoliensis]AKU18141.1 Na(+)/H(+) antiporter NhaA [Luteipulveratus mongoliensis]
MALPTPNKPRLFSRGAWPEAKRVTEALRAETVGGALLLLAALLAIIWANTPWRDSYASLRDVHVGPSALGLDLSLAHWASDGLLAIFFFVVGLELKHEFVAGDLKDPAKAALPVIAAVCGVAVPALIFAAVNTVGGGDAHGWAIPTATDIAFALAILAVLGTHLPSALRSFLLTLAVVDDLIAITIIALFYSDDIDLALLGLALIPIAVFGVLVQRRVHQWWALLPVGLVAWALVLNSGIHATIAGVVLGLLVPVKAVRRGRGSAEGVSLASRLEHRLRPISAGVAVPVFAFMAAGVTVVGGGLGDAVTDPITIGIVAGLVVGKMIGIMGGTYLTARFTKAELDDELAWSDVFGLSLLAGIGFTVSLLIGELAFGAGSDSDDHVKIGVLAGSVLAALLAAMVLRRRNDVYRRIEEYETRDDDGDGVPDCYESDAARA